MAVAPTGVRRHAGQSSGQQYEHYNKSIGILSGYRGIHQEH